MLGILRPRDGYIGAMREGRPRIRSLVGALVVAGVLAAPGSAFANNPLTGVPATTATTPATTGTATVTTATSTAAATTGGGLSSIDQIGIGVVVVVLFGSIAYVIRSDARAHVSKRATIDIDRERATVKPRAERVKDSRAKAKAARRARRARR
jgi:hypothetical protein